MAEDSVLNYQNGNRSPGVLDKQRIMPYTESHQYVKIHPFIIQYFSLGYGATHRFPLPRTSKLGGYLLLIRDANPLLFYASSLAADRNNIKAPVF